MTPIYVNYPDDCFQYLCDPWWLKSNECPLSRGRLIWAFVPHVDQVPCALSPIGRTDSREHQLADCEITPLSIDTHIKKSTLPVAGLTCYDGELRTVYRAKKRPMLLIALAGHEIPKSLTRGKPKYQTSATHLAIPYYGGNTDGKRAGFNPEFLKKIRHCSYPQFSWDMLPIDGAEESVLRIDHIQPISTHYKSFEPTEYILSDDALMFMDEWIAWHLSGQFPDDDSLFGFTRLELSSL